MATQSLLGKPALVVREHDPLTGMSHRERDELIKFVLKQPPEQPTVLEIRGGNIYAQNYVGVIETTDGTRIEILPKIDLSTETGANEDATRRIFLTMLQTCPGLEKAVPGGTSLQKTQHLDMLEAYVHLFLVNVTFLVQRGLARAYRTREANLQCLRGRILFPQHLRMNLVDRSRFYVGYDELTANLPANRLIHHTLRQLMTVVRFPSSRQLISQLLILLSHVPRSTNPYVDRARARDRVDHSMRHYAPVMQWVELFLFGYGLAPFAGKHQNCQLVFPMETVFEHFVADAVRRYQDHFDVLTQGHRRALAKDPEDHNVFWMRPDIALMKGGKVCLILDSKWKRLNSKKNHYEVSQGDAYQLFAYAKGYKCKRVMLVYPWNKGFQEWRSFTFTGDDNPKLFCFPFKVDDPEQSVSEMMGVLTQ